MAQVVNIRRDISDAFYRYRMPLLQTKIEGKGNGIKTVIPNMADIARSLSRPPSYPTKFFGCELGAQTTFDEKNERYIVNGAHDATRLRELLDTFIDKFVLCGSCKNPETELILTKTDDVIRDCKACGQRTIVDMRHKLVTFILKNPPPKKKGKGGKKGHHTPGAADGPSAGDADGADEAGSDDELTQRIRSEVAEIPTAEQRAKENGGDEDWSVDTSEAAVKARVKALEGGVQSALVLGDDDEEGAGGPYEEFGEWLEAHKVKGAGDGAPTSAEVYKKAQELGIDKKHRAVQVLVQGLFTEEAVKEVPKYGAVLQKMVTSEKHQKALLGGLERLVGEAYPSLMPTGVPKLLMAFYQVDVLDEEVAKQWGTHVSGKYVDKSVSKKVRKSAGPFLEWLDQAESDEESE